MKTPKFFDIYIFCFALICLQNMKAYAQYDFDKPTLSSISVSPTSIDLSSGNVTITVSLQASDTSGIATPSTNFGAYIYDYAIVGSDIYFSGWELIDGDQYNETYQCYTSIEATKVPSGNYEINIIANRFIDNAGNSGANLPHLQTPFSYNYYNNLI